MSGMDLHSGTALLLLGAVHGLNPGMGWLFAVALGLQERRRRALWGALPPLAAGHAAAILAALAAAALLGRALPSAAVEWVVGTGGALTRIPGGDEILRGVCRGPGHLLLPTPEARVLIDRDYRFSALGTLAQAYPDDVRATFRRWVGIGDGSDPPPGGG